MLAATLWHCVAGRLRWVVAAALVSSAVASRANAAGPDPSTPVPGGKSESEFDYQRSRFEPAGIPLVGEDSDIGTEFGAAVTLSKLGHGVRPYQWNMDVVTSVSVKSGPDGKAELTQENFLWTLDVPGLNGGSLRIVPAVSYISTINQGYFGLGNGSSAQRPAQTSNPGRYFEYTDRTAMARQLTRVRIHSPVDLMLAGTYRFASPEAYPGSKLAADAAAGRIIGLQPLSLVQAGVGIVYDSRDNEYFPRGGSFHQIGVRFVQGIPFEAGAQYAALGAIFSFYRSIGGPFVIAWRALIDAEVGQVPFYDLFMGEPFTQDQIIGGSAGVRGVPEGRYLGRLKTLANVELRAMLIDFRVLGQSLHLGGDLLFDVGRTWLDYSFSASEDGSALSLKWGAGAGIYLRWGQAGVFRLEAAYSPDAAAVNPSLPIGLYVQDGVMF
jgi:hypothetical protein